MNYSRGAFLRRLGAAMVGTAAAAPLVNLLGEAMTNAPTASDAVVGLPKAGETTLNARIVNNGPGLGRRIAATFDDGPTPGVTEIVLEELKKRDLKATFFMIGHRVTEAPDLARRVLAEGHEIGNHTFTHPKLNSLPDDKVKWELESCQDAIATALNQKPVWFRPPYGAFRKNQGPMALEKGLGVAYWSVDPKDWSQPGVSSIVNTILTQTQPGSIVLMHDLHKQTAQAVGQVLDGLLERGFEFTNLSGFLGQPYETV